MVHVHETSSSYYVTGITIPDSKLTYGVIFNRDDSFGRVIEMWAEDGGLTLPDGTYSFSSLVQNLIVSQARVAILDYINRTSVVYEKGPTMTDKFTFTNFASVERFDRLIKDISERTVSACSLEEYRERYGLGCIIWSDTTKPYPGFRWSELIYNIDRVSDEDIEHAIDELTRAKYQFMLGV